jgi:hypothetical protein
MLILAAMISACSGAATPDAGSIDAVLTEGVQTLVGAYFATQTALVTPATSTSAPTATRPASSSPLPFPSGSVSPSPTWPYVAATLGTPLTASPTGTQFTATPNPSALAYGCNNLAFVRDVTIPSGTILKPGEDFNKTWKVANSGTCNWMYQYALALVGGDAMDGKTTKLGKVVTVNDWAELSVGLAAPHASGTYSSYWRLMDADGHFFGATLGVTIKVGAPTNTPQPTAIPSATPLPSDTATPSETTTP